MTLSTRGALFTFFLFVMTNQYQIYEWIEKIFLFVERRLEQNGGMKKENV